MRVIAPRLWNEIKAEVRRVGRVFVGKKAIGSSDEIGNNSSWKIEEDFNHNMIELEVRYCRKTRLVVKAFEKR